MYTVVAEHGHGRSSSQHAFSECSLELTASLGWRRAAGATAYRVKAGLSDGRRLLLTVRGRSVRIPAFGTRETAKVSVAQDAAFHLYARGATDYAP